MQQAVSRSARRVLQAGIITAAAGSLAAGCGAPQSQATYRGYSYTCCSADLGATVWHAGQTLRVSWSTTPEQISGSGPTGLTLTLLLTGPYASVSALKSANAGSASTVHPGGRIPLATAPAIRTTTRAGGTPVSVLVIPRDAPPGFYNLQFGVRSGGGSSDGATIIQVAA